MAPIFFFTFSIHSPSPERDPSRVTPNDVANALAASPRVLVAGEDSQRHTVSRLPRLTLSELSAEGNGAFAAGKAPFVLVGTIGSGVWMACVCDLRDVLCV